MDWMKLARDGFSMLAEGRQAVTRVVDAVKDGSAALSTTEKAELDRMLAEETRESRAAHDSLDAALREADQRGDGGGT